MAPDAPELKGLDLEGGEYRCENCGYHLPSIKALVETNRKLHRRAQQAESDLAWFKKRHESWVEANIERAWGYGGGGDGFWGKASAFFSRQRDEARKECDRLVFALQAERKTVANLRAWLWWIGLGSIAWQRETGQQAAIRTNALDALQDVPAGDDLMRSYLKNWERVGRSKEGADAVSTEQP